MLTRPQKQDLTKWPECNRQPNFERWLRSFHTVQKPWHLALDGVASEEDSCIWIHDVVEMLLRKPRDPKVISVLEVCHKPMHHQGSSGLEDATGSYCDDPDFDVMDEGRWERACPLVPGIVAEGALNPCASRFRMIDGRHRICKLKMETNMAISHAPFFVLNETEVLSLVVPNCSEDSAGPPTKLRWEDFEDAWHHILNDRQAGETRVDSVVLEFVRASLPTVLRRAPEEL